MSDNQGAERLISFYSAGETGFTEFNVQPDGTGDFYSMQAGEENAYEFEIESSLAEQYRDRLRENLREGTALKQPIGTSNTQVSVYTEDSHETGQLTKKGKEVIEEMMDAFEENKK